MAVIDQDKINEIKVRLKALPPVNIYTKQSAVEALSHEIMALYHKGYEPKQIAEILKKEGLSASATKMRRIIDEEKDKSPASSEKPNRKIKPGTNTRKEQSNE